MQRWTNSTGQRERSLWSFLSQQLYKKNSEESKTNDKRRWIVLSSTLVVFVVVLFVILEPSFAAPSATASENSISKTIINWAIGGIAKIVVWLAEQLGFILIFLIDLLISIVQYNNFVKATPVQIGWPLIRDTVNMFFIVIVLVSAFATIIGYPQGFRYREVLPKLLIMAVLINFSKTLIGLLIDFSQVIVLTFVNGFKQAAGGNFVSALGISKIMRLSDTTGIIEETGGEIKVTLGQGKASGDTSWSLMNIVIAAIFAVWIISISITLILIMLIFFLARIIMLWFLLITSPIAFFAWALPDKLKNALSAFTNEWWDRLSKALIGGPTMAFFLWLSLAMAQRQSDLVGSAGLYNPESASSEISQFQASAQKDKFITPSEFGDPEVFATFIIMVAFMLLGVQTSVKFAGAVAPGTEKLINMVGGKSAVEAGVLGTLAAGRFAGRSAKRSAALTGAAIVGGAGLAYGGAKLAGRGAKFVGKEAAARSRVVSDAAGSILQNKYIGFAPASVQKKIADVHGAPKRAAQAKARELQGIGASMKPHEYTEFLENQIAAAEGSIVPGVDGAILPARIGDLDGMKLALAQQAMSNIAQDDLNKQNKDLARKQLGEGASDEAVDARARELTNHTVAQQLVKAEEFAREHNNDDMLKKIKEMREKNPGLVMPGESAREQARKDASDTESERRIRPDAFMSATYALNYASGKGWIDDKGEVLAHAHSDPEYQKFMRGKQGKYMKAHLEYARSSDAAKSQVQQIITGKNVDGTAFSDTGHVGADGEVLEGKDLVNAQLAARNYTVNVSRDGEEFHVVQNQNFDVGTKPSSMRGVERVMQGRFDGVTNDPKKIVKDDALRAELSANLAQLGTVKDEKGNERAIAVQDIARAIEPAVAKELNSDLANLAETRSGGRSGGINLDQLRDERAEIGEKYLKQGVSTKVLYGHDAKTGDFANDEGREAFQQTMEKLVEKMQNGNFTQDTMATLSNIAKQIGTQGEAFEMMQRSMGELNQGEIYRAMTTGEPDQKDAIRKSFLTISAQGRKDRDEGKTGTAAMQFRENAFKSPPEDAGQHEYAVHERIGRIMFEGKY